jgi:hypothetical protein
MIINIIQKLIKVAHDTDISVMNYEKNLYSYLCSNEQCCWFCSIVRSKRR